MSDKKTKYIPDYKNKCEVCDKSPVVTVVAQGGKVTGSFDMCGPCTFGTSEAINPDSW